MERGSGWLLWLSSDGSVAVGRGPLSCLRSWFSWLTRSSWPSSSSMRRLCVSSSLAWLSMMLLSSSRYSTARLGLSGLVSMMAALIPLGPVAATVRTPWGQDPPPPPAQKSGGREGPRHVLRKVFFVCWVFMNKPKQLKDSQSMNVYITQLIGGKRALSFFCGHQRKVKSPAC